MTRSAADRTVLDPAIVRAELAGTAPRPTPTGATTVAFDAWRLSPS
jgi:hypothetical protein